MMGQHTRSESLFYYFRLEDQVPESHLLRLIDRHSRPRKSGLSLTFVIAAITNQVATPSLFNSDFETSRESLDIGDSLNSFASLRQRRLRFTISIA